MTAFRIYAEDDMDNRQLGTVIILVTIAMFFVLVSFTIELNRYLHSFCIAPDGTCPHAGNLPFQSYMGFSLVLILGITGMYVFRKKGETETTKVREWDSTIKTLEGDERMVFEIVKSEGGVMFQSDLIEKTGFSKVKVSRILDKLQARGLLERKRRGMTNAVVLK